MRNSRDETLPGWTYDNAEFFALEREHLLLSSWALAGHRSDLKAPGDFLSVDSCGERGLVVLGDGGVGGLEAVDHRRVGLGVGGAQRVAELAAVGLAGARDVLRGRPVEDELGLGVEEPVGDRARVLPGRVGGERRRAGQQDRGRGRDGDEPAPH
jgi:hypothetical protein